MHAAAIATHPARSTTVIFSRLLDKTDIERELPNLHLTLHAKCSAVAAFQNGSDSLADWRKSPDSTMNECRRYADCDRFDMRRHLLVGYQQLSDHLEELMAPAAFSARKKTAEIGRDALVIVPKLMAESARDRLIGLHRVIGASRQ
ncbi:MAG: hypothetical protein ABIQ70_02220 [Dokdonella sp.]